MKLSYPAIEEEEDYSRYLDQFLDVCSYMKLLAAERILTSMAA